jgi:hypothetical protein
MLGWLSVARFLGALLLVSAAACESGHGSRGTTNGPPLRRTAFGTSAECPPEGPGQIRGKATTVTGKPIGNLGVVLLDESARRPYLMTETDVTGMYSFVGLPQAKYVVRFFQGDDELRVDSMADIRHVSLVVANIVWKGPIRERIVRDVFIRLRCPIFADKKRAQVPRGQ